MDYAYVVEAKNKVCGYKLLCVFQYEDDAQSYVAKLFQMCEDFENGNHENISEELKDIFVEYYFFSYKKLPFKSDS